MQQAARKAAKPIVLPTKLHKYTLRLLNSASNNYKLNYILIEVSVQSYIISNQQP